VQERIAAGVRLGSGLILVEPIYYVDGTFAFGRGPPGATFPCS
jgi:hypothetical protein